jgi:hypothetical protein
LLMLIWLTLPEISPTPNLNLSKLYLFLRSI